MEKNAINNSCVIILSIGVISNFLRNGRKSAVFSSACDSEPFHFPCLNGHVSDAETPWVVQ